MTCPVVNSTQKCIVKWAGLDKSPVFANFILAETEVAQKPHYVILATNR